MFHLLLIAWQRRGGLLGGLLLAILGAGGPQSAHGQASSAPYDVSITPTDLVALPPGGSQVLTATATYPAGGVDAPVYAVALQPDGKVLLGGAFVSYQNAPAGHLVRLTAAGTLDASFALAGTGLDGDVKAIARQADGKVLVGGNFRHYNGAVANYLARLNANGSLDTSFLPAGDPTVGPSGPVAAIVVQPDGKILIGGDFATYSGVARSALARVLASGALDATFQTTYASTSSPVRALALQADGRILVGGSLSSYSSTGTTTARNYIARFDTYGNLDAAFAPPQVSPAPHPIANYVTAIVVQPDGKILIGGYVGYISGQTVGFVRRLNESGTTDFAYSGGASSSTFVTALALQPDGKILAGESTFIGLGRYHDLIRLTTAGTLDAVVATCGPGQQVHSIAVQPTGQLWFGGTFTLCNGHSTGYFAALNPDGTFALPVKPVAGVAYTWNTGTPGPTLAVAAPGVYAVTATANGQSVASAPVFITGGAYRLHAGGGALVTNRGPFAADAYYSPSSSAAGTSASIAGTQDPALYQTERFSTNGTLSYALPVANGTYQVVLYFAEIYWTQPGQRVFNISLEGQLRRANYDIVKKVGPLVATSELFTVTVTDGVLNLDLRVPYESGGADQAKLSALEVLPASPPLPLSGYNRAPDAFAGYEQTLTLPPPPFALGTTSTTLQGSGNIFDSSDNITSYRWSQLSGPTTATFSSLAEASPIVGNLAAGTYVFGLVVYDSYGVASTVSSVTIKVNPSPYVAVLRFNAGGPAVNTSRGDFAADNYSDAGSQRFATSAAIGRTPDPVLYQTERSSTNGALHFTFNVGNGDYVVVLHFAEIYWTAVGQRVFDVSLEGTKVLDKYDIVRQAGSPLYATTETFPVTVADGVLNLDLVVPYGNGGADQAKISALEVLHLVNPAPASAAPAQALRAAAAPGPARPLGTLGVYPNPSAGRCTVACQVDQARAATLTLTDPLGRVVQQRAVQLQAGDNQLAVSATGLAPGLYQLSLVTADGQRQRQKLLIQP